MKTHPTKGYTISAVDPLTEVNVMIDTWALGLSVHEPKRFSIDIEFRREKGCKEFYDVTPVQFNRIMTALKNSPEFEGTVDPTHGIFVRSESEVWRSSRASSCLITEFKRKE